MDGAIALPHIFFLCLILFHYNLPSIQAHKRKWSHPAVPAMLVFGDSIVDPGNNNQVATLVRANFPPYGSDLKGMPPTGRFTNGKLPTDYIAEKLGVKEFIPSFFFNNKLTDEEILTGVSFASAGTGYDPATSLFAHVISYWREMEMFKEYKNRVLKIIGKEKTETLLAKTLVVSCAGSNDVVGYFRSPRRMMIIDQYADYLVGITSKFIQELFDHGVRKVGIVGIPPVGCIPFVRAETGGIFGAECGEEYNKLSQAYNSKIDAELKRLSTKLNGTTLVYFDIYNILLDLIQKPQSYGFKVSRMGCCGTGLVEAAVLCNSFSSMCSNVSSYVFFDSFHPTSGAYEIIATKVLEKYGHVLGFV